jgi:hypothetical protein
MTMNAFQQRWTLLTTLSVLLYAAACNSTTKQTPPVPTGNAGGKTTSGGATTAGRAAVAGARAAGTGGGRSTTTAGAGGSRAKPVDGGVMDAGGKKPAIGDKDAGLDDGDGSVTRANTTIGVTWVGTTSQGRDITFDVSDDGLTEFRISYAFPGCDGDNKVTFSPPLPLGTRFSVSFQLAGATNVTFAGTFLPGNRASGTLAFMSTVDPGQPACGAGGLTWMATTP